MPIVYRTTNYDYIDWKTSIEHFFWDRMQEAHETASGTLGVAGQYLPWYRMIEAEWIPRSHGQIEQVNEWLKVEYIPGELGGVDGLGARVEAICEQTAQSFRIEERPEILVSVLSVNSDAPWVDARAGYFIDKYPYDKICIPHRSVFEQTELERVVSHEYVHALNLNLTQGKCPLWLNEGIAMLTEPKLDPQIRRDLASGEAPWKNPHRLDGAFHAETEGERDYAAIHQAYAQAAWIVRYLSTLGGRIKIADLLRAFNDNSFLEELKMRFVSEDPAEEALRQTYGFGEKHLFDEAHRWMQSQT